MAKDTVLNALMLLKAIHDNREAAGAVIPGPLQSKEIVLLAPMTLKQLNEAIAAERQRIQADEALNLTRMQQATVTVVDDEQPDHVAPAAIARWEDDGGSKVP